MYAKQLKMKRFKGLFYCFYFLFPASLLFLSSQNLKSMFYFTKGNQLVSTSQPAEKDQSISTYQPAERDQLISTFYSRKNQSMNISGPWNAVTKRRFLPSNSANECVQSTTRPSFRICIHPREDDRFVSTDIKRTGMWEYHVWSTLISATLHQYHFV